MKYTLLLHSLFIVSACVGQDQTEKPQPQVFTKQRDTHAEPRGNPEHRKKFIETGSCYKCDLRDFPIAEDIKKHRGGIFAALYKSLGWYQEPVFLFKTNLSGSNCANADFVGADLQGVNFSDADCHNADFGASNVSGAKFIKTNLTEANFSHANCRGANFQKATLTSTNFSYASLKKAIFSASVVREKIMQSPFFELDDATFVDDSRP